MLLLIATIVVLPTTLTSCGDDEPETPENPNPNPGDDEEDKFTDLYGYWLNTDKSGAMSIELYTKSQCKVIYYAFSKDRSKLYTKTSYYAGSSGSITALVPSSTRDLSVHIQTSTPDRILLQKDNNQADDLTSYIFNRVTEDAFFEFLEGGNNNHEDDSKKLIGTWVGKDYDETYTITFYSSGNGKEIWTDGYDTETMTGKYKYSNGKITSWLEDGDGSILINVLGDCPWTVTFNSETSMTLVSKLSKMTFTKK